jgi:DNA-binding MarR family transcriptional regulator
MTHVPSVIGTMVTEPIIADPVLDFMRLLWNVEHGLQSRSKWMEATLGITGPQRLVLRIVRDRPDLSAGELAHILHLHPSTITGILQRLVSKGLLQRTRDRHDSRRVRLRARAAAQRLMDPSSITVEAAIKGALTSIPPRRIQHAREVLTAIADTLAEIPARGIRQAVGGRARRRSALRRRSAGR